MLNELFAAIDRRDAAAFAEFLTDDAVFYFANAAPVRGKSAIEDAVAGFFRVIAAIEHQIDDSWDTGDVLICHGRVSYTRHDEQVVTVPFALVLYLHQDKIREYRIFADHSAVFASSP